MIFFIYISTIKFSIKMSIIGIRNGIFTNKNGILDINNDIFTRKKSNYWYQELHLEKKKT